MTKDEILDNYVRRVSSRGKSKNMYAAMMRKYLDFSKGELTREAVERYMLHLEKRGYAATTRHTVYGTLTTLFKRNKVEWPFGRAEGPQVREMDVNAPALAPEVVIAMIEAAKAGRMNDERTAFLCLSTVYGLRRVEMQEIEDTCVRIADRTIFVATAKHGRQRNHLLPDEIVPYLENYTFPPHTEFDVFAMWYNIEADIGMEHHPRVGFHSIRRTLATELGHSLPDTVVRSFLRWKKATSGDMLFRYSAVSYIGFDGEQQMTLTEGTRSEDMQVFEKHPFLEYWR